MVWPLKKSWVQSHAGETDEVFARSFGSHGVMAGVCEGVFDQVRSRADGGERFPRHSDAHRGLSFPQDLPDASSNPPCPVISAQAL